MKSLLTILSLALLSLTASAANPALGGQASGHSNSLTWTASPTPGTTVNLYRANAACSTNPTFGAAIQTGLPAGGPATDPTTPVAGVNNWCYYVTAVLNGAESVPSNKLTLTLTVSPQPPTGLAGTAQ